MTNIINSKKLIFAILFLMVTVFFCGVPQKTLADEAPLAARLLAEPYDTTGVRVTVTNLNNMYGLANDGTYAYIIDGSNAKILTVPLADIAALSGGSSTTTVGTVHNVGWSVNGAPAFPDSSQLSLAYSHGCIFITDNSNTSGTIKLNCIDVSDYSVTDIPVPTSTPLPAGYYFAFSNLIDFPDGRIGKVSAEEAYGDQGHYKSTLRTYTLTGTGKNVSLAWSHDFVMDDPNYFAVDEHGIATDGTYLYRFQWRDFNPNTKVWALSNTETSTVVYSGQFTMPFDNMHYLAHNHTNSYYLMGHYSSNHFFMTKVADPGPGPGNPLTPTFSTPTSTATGYTVQVTNYDASFTWSVTSTAGSTQIDSSGIITVSGLTALATATTTVTTTKSGVPDGSASVSGAASADATAPDISNTTTSISSTSANFSWDTNEAASAQVAFGFTISYTSSTAITDVSPRTTTHSVSLTGLPNCASYHYAVISADAGGNTTTSTDSTFTTLGCVASTTPTTVSSTVTTVSSGGSLSMSTSSLTITVTTPADVTSTSTSLVIQIQEVAKDAVFNLIGRPTSTPNEIGDIVFDVKAIINNTTILDSFDHPVTISYQYSDSDITGIDESTLWLYHYHDGSWQALDSCSVDTASNTITCTTPSFSIFALFGQTASQTTSNNGGGITSVIPTAVQITNSSIPTPLSFTINDDSSVTNNSSLTLHLNADYQTVRGYAVSLDKTFAGESIRQFDKTTTSTNFLLPSTPGSYTVYLKYYSITGVYSPVIERTIILSGGKTAMTKKTPSTLCKYTTTLRRGSRGVEVRDLQTFLKAQGSSIYPEGVVNGVFGPATHQAVVRFQEKYTDDVLKPWRLTKGTGYVYKTTKAKMCALSKEKLQ